MAYCEITADRVRNALAERTRLTERKMFGGIAFMLGGHMCAGVIEDRLMLRVGPEAYPSALAQPHAREMDFTGKPMRGMIYLDSAGFEAEEALGVWLQRAVDFALSLPPK